MDQPFTLTDVVTNSELARRSSRAPEYQAENQALDTLAQMLAHSPQSVLQKLVEVAQELCRADSTGISPLEEHGGEYVFRWEAWLESCAIMLMAQCREMPVHAV